ncbi:MAG TPA: LysE family translocator [Actinomycetales bacterium]|nr:LysE family translocator [Actinomycetales bacterium]
MEALAVGLTIGLAAGISPGPLLVLVITSSLKSGWRAGALAACGPLLSDVFIVGTTLLVLDHLPHRTLPALGVVGAAFIVWTGAQTIREARDATLSPDGTARALTPFAAWRQAATVNVLSPHPWVAWATALGPLVVSTWRDSHPSAIWLVAGFYVTLVGAKIAVAALVAGGRRHLHDTGYRRALVASGVLLVLAGVALAVEFAPQLV